MSTGSRVGIEVLAGRCDLTTKEVGDVFAAIVTLMEEGRPVTVVDFGRFEPRFIKPRPCVSPVLNGPTMTRARRKIRFTLSDKLRQRWTDEAPETQEVPSGEESE